MKQPTTGERISNYLLDEQIGAGSFGIVWRAKHHVFGDHVAIKLPSEPSAVRYLQREAMVVHGLAHPNIVRVLDCDPYADPPYLIAEYVAGISLRELIEKHPKGLPVESTVAVLFGAVSALDAAHRAGFLHRDIKPANILLVSPVDAAELTPAQIKVTDFGLGEGGRSHNESMRQSGSMAVPASQGPTGTLAYMSPEQRDGAELDERTDLYSCGVVLHEMLTGVLPQGGDPPSLLRREVPDWLDQLFQHLHTGRDRRIRSAEAVRQEILRCWPAASRWADTQHEAEARTVRDNGTLRCADCDERVGETDQFCIQCGKQLVEVVPRCASCHAFADHGDNYCMLCGSDLRTRV